MSCSFNLKVFVRYIPLLCAALAGLGLVTAYALRRQNEIPVKTGPVYAQIYVDDTAPLYILSAADGVIAVTQEGQVVDVVSRPVTALPPEEQALLNEGIAVFTEEQLLRLLQDYGS